MLIRVELARILLIEMGLVSVIRHADRDPWEGL